MSTKIKVKSKTTLGKKKPIKPKFSSDSGLLTQKIVVVVKKEKGKNK